MIDRLFRRDEETIRRRADSFKKLPLSFQVLFIGAMMRFQSQEEKTAYVDAMVEATRNDEEDPTWTKRSFALFLDGPTRRIANHRMDDAVMEFMQKRSN